MRLRETHDGVLWGKDENGYVHRLDEALDEWVMWDPDEPGPQPPPQFYGGESKADKDRRVVMSLIAAVVAFALGLFIYNNLQESQSRAKEDAERLLCELRGTVDC